MTYDSTGLAPRTVLGLFAPLVPPHRPHGSVVGSQQRRSGQKLMGLFGRRVLGCVQIPSDVTLEDVTLQMRLLFMKDHERIDGERASWSRIHSLDGTKKPFRGICWSDVRIFSFQLSSARFCEKHPGTSACLELLRFFPYTR